MVCMYVIQCLSLLGLMLNATKFVANLVHFQLPRNVLVPCLLYWFVLQLEGTMCILTPDFF